MRGPEIAEDKPPDTDRVLTVPNIVSMIRLLGIPVFIWLLTDERRLAAAVLLAAIAWTDWIDGGLARRWHQVTTLGKVLDPTIDRFLILAAFIGGMLDGSVPPAIGFIFLARELAIGIGGVILGLKGHRRISVTWHGKVYAFGAMVALPLFFVANTSVFWADFAEIFAWAFAIPSAVLSWYTAYQYARKATMKTTGL